MAYETISEEYFNWLSDIVTHKSRKGRYKKLLNDLFFSEFYAKIAKDENRAIDGEGLRIRFAHAVGYNEFKIREAMDDRPCSVLEMIIALADRIEDQIMGEDELGDETYKWFWEMIDNLGLSYYTDDRYDEEAVDAIIDRFLQRKYNKDGRGGLFYIGQCKKDVRKIEIWYQMCWYLDEILY